MFSIVKFSLRTQLLLVGLLLCFLHLVFPIPENGQLFLFATGIIITGIPHGSIDHLLYLQLYPNAHPVYKWFRFLSFYLGYALLYGILWIIHVEFALLFFIGISAYHFGEMDLKNMFQRSGMIEKVISTAYGLLFLLNYLLFRWQEVQEILWSFPGFSFGNSGLFSYLYEIRLYLMILSIMLLMSALLVYYQTHKKSFTELILPVLQLTILCLITFKLPILLGFGFYFNAWHASLSITEIKAALGWTDRSWFYAIKKAWITNLAAFVFIGFMLFYFRGDFSRSMAVLFMCIAILTAPHIQVISRLFQQRA